MNWTDEELRARRVLREYEQRGWQVVFAVGNQARLTKDGKQKDIRIEQYGVTESPEVQVGS